MNWGFSPRTGRDERPVFPSVEPRPVPKLANQLEVGAQFALLLG